MGHDEDAVTVALDALAEEAASSGLKDPVAQWARRLSTAATGVVSRGEPWWIDFGDPVASAPGYPRPGLLVSSDRFNRSRIST